MSAADGELLSSNKTGIIVVFSLGKMGKEVFGMKLGLENGKQSNQRIVHVVE